MLRLSGILVLVTTLGCTGASLDWSHDEVTIIGVRTQGGTADAVLLDVKNVQDLEDGHYLFTLPTDLHRSQASGDGIALMLEHVAERPGIRRFFSALRVNSYRDELVVHNASANYDVRARVQRDAQRRYSVEIAVDASRTASWSCIGTVVIGVGTQDSSRKPIAYAALPITIAMDIAVPLAVLTGYVYAVAYLFISI